LTGAFVTVVVNSREYSALVQLLMLVRVIVPKWQYDSDNQHFHGRSCKNRCNLRCARFYRAGLCIFVAPQPIRRKVPAARLLYSVEINEIFISLQLWPANDSP
jgi:hypothetical protein